MSRGLIPGPIWKMQCYNLFIIYFQLKRFKKFHKIKKKNQNFHKISKLSKNFIRFQNFQKISKFQNISITKLAPHFIKK